MDETCQEIKGTSTPDSFAMIHAASQKLQENIADCLAAMKEATGRHRIQAVTGLKAAEEDAKSSKSIYYAAKDALTNEIASHLQVIEQRDHAMTALEVASDDSSKYAFLESIQIDELDPRIRVDLNRITGIVKGKKETESECKRAVEEVESRLDLHAKKLAERKEELEQAEVHFNLGKQALKELDEMKFLTREDESLDCDFLAERGRLER